MRRRVCCYFVRAEHPRAIIAQLVLWPQLRSFSKAESIIIIITSASTGPLLDKSLSHRTLWHGKYVIVHEWDMAMAEGLNTAAWQNNNLLISYSSSIALVISSDHLKVFCRLTYLCSFHRLWLLTLQFFRVIPQFLSSTSVLPVAIDSSSVWW